MKRNRNAARWAAVAIAVAASWAGAYLLGRGAAEDLHAGDAPAGTAPAPSPAQASTQVSSRPAAAPPFPAARPAPPRDEPRDEIVAADPVPGFDEGDDTGEAPSRPDDAGAIGDMLAVLDEVKSRGLLELRLDQAVAPMGMTEIAGAVDALAGLPPGPRRDQALLAVIHRWAQLDPMEALGYAEEEVMPALRQQMVQSVLSGWARRNPAEALAFTEANPDWSYAGIGAHAAFEGISRLPASEALQVLGQIDPAVHGVHISQSLARLAQRDVDAVMQWATDLPPGSLRGQAIQQVISITGQYDPTATLAWMEDLSGGEADAGQLSTLGRVWAMHDPEAARNWVLALPGESGDGAVAKGVFDAWFRVDGSAARDWLDTVAPDPRLDPAFQTYANSLRRRAPDQAMAVTANILGNGARRQVQRQVLGDWLRRDPEEAMQQLLETPLPAGDLEPLLEEAQRRIERGGGPRGRGRGR